MPPAPSPHCTPSAQEQVPGSVGFCGAPRPREARAGERPDHGVPRRPLVMVVLACSPGWGMSSPRARPPGTRPAPGFVGSPWGKGHSRGGAPGASTGSLACAFLLPGRRPCAARSSHFLSRLGAKDVAAPASGVCKAASWGAGAGLHSELWEPGPSPPDRRSPSAGKPGIPGASRVGGEYRFPPRLTRWGPPGASAGLAPGCALSPQGGVSCARRCPPGRLPPILGERQANLSWPCKF